MLLRLGDQLHCIAGSKTDFAPLPPLVVGKHVENYCKRHISSTLSNASQQGFEESDSLKLDFLSACLTKVWLQSFELD